MKTVSAIALIVAVVIIVMLFIVVPAVARAQRRRRQRSARWSVDPRTLESGDRQVWLVREGEDDFLYDTVRRDDYGRLDPDAWSRVLYEAEAQALEFDRLERR